MIPKVHIVRCLYYHFRMSTLDAARQRSHLDVHRGSPQRITDWMEQYQIGLIRSIASAAGCEYLPMQPDQGIDALIARYEGSVMDSQIQVQLKAVSGQSRWNADRSRIHAELSAERYADAIKPKEDLIIRTIFLILDLPAEVDAWIDCQNESMQLHNHCYWVSLEGKPSVLGTQNVRISAPIEHLFDDAALCEILEKVKEGKAL